MWSMGSSNGAVPWQKVRNLFMEFVFFIIWLGLDIIGIEAVGLN